MITRADCPAKAADLYPGKRTRSNPAGILLTRKEYVAKQVQDWIDHFEDSEQYQSEILSVKVKYLVHHLRVLNITTKVARKLLVELESKHQADEGLSAVANSLVEIEHDENDIDMIDNEPPGDVDMFSDDESDGKRAAYEFELRKVLSKTDTELFELGYAVSERVARSNKYIEREKLYTERYVDQNMEGLNSQEILETFSQNPVSVQKSVAMQKKVNHLSKKQKTNKSVLKSLQDTIDVLSKTPGRVAKRQLEVITAASTHHRNGTPSFEGVSRRTERTAKKMKLDLLQGNVSVLTPPIQTKKQVYPQPCVDLALKHWNENTTPEPALHRRKAETDDQETVPTRYQCLTDREQYSQFKEDCSGEMAEILRKYSTEQIEKNSKRSESTDKTRRLAYLESLPTKVPSIDWYLDLKPAEVKPMHDHTTALCRICEAALLNYTTIVKTMKLQCKCTMPLCPNWMCLCEQSEDEFEVIQCDCKCACDNCSNCKVNKS